MGRGNRADLKHDRATTGQIAAIIWAATVAVSVNLFFHVRWWHPYCKYQADGPGHFAIGLPFPFAEPTGASSMEFNWMPHVYLLNTLILAVLDYLLVQRLTFQRFLKTRRTAKVIAGVGIAALLLVGTSQAFVWTTGWWPREIIPLTGSDRYFDFRPAFLVDPNRNGRCFE